MIKRSVTTIIGLPAVLVILIFGNKYILDVIMAILAIMGIYEYMKCVAHKFNPVYWIGYVAAASIALLHIIPSNYLIEYLAIAILSLIAVLFMHVVFTDMKTNAADIAITLFGILYIVGFFSFVALLYGYESNGRSLGKFYIAYLFLKRFNFASFISISCLFFFNFTIIESNFGIFKIRPTLCLSNFQFGRNYHFVFWICNNFYTHVCLPCRKKQKDGMIDRIIWIIQIQDNRFSHFTTFFVFTIIQI